MRRPVLIATILALTGGCAPVDPADVAATAKPIIGGTPDTGMDLGLPVIFIRNPAGDVYGLCSGSMITRRVLMTAAHCVEGVGDSFDAWFADAVDAETGEFTGRIDTVRRTATEVWVHPMFDIEDPPKGFDIALLLLDSPMPDTVATLDWNRERLNPGTVGDPIRMAGFGIRELASDDLDFIKMTANNFVSAVQSNRLEVAGLTMVTAEGDSGGPAFLTLGGREVVAGITSYHTVGIGVRTSSFGRVDRYYAEISAFIDEHDPQVGSCGDDGVCGYPCTTVDPDCPCSRDTQCTTACPTSDRDPDCPVGCAAGGTCVRQGCPTPDPDCGEKPVGDACTANGQCLSGLCAMDGNERVCAEPCAGGTCADGFTCKSGACFAEDSGGCAVGGGRTGAGPLAALLAALAFFSHGLRWRAARATSGRPGSRAGAALRR